MTNTTAISATQNQAKEFLLSGSAAVGAICFTNPLDVVKTRLQLQGELAKGPKVYNGTFDALCKISKKEGIRGMQRGLAPACLLQFSNVSMRFGAYAVTKYWFDITPESKNSWVKSIVAGGVSGALAAIVSNPFFLLKTRFQAQCTDATLAVGHQHVQANLREAFVAIYKTDGVMGYYRGLTAFIPRVVVASAVQLSSYDVIKHAFMSRFDMQDALATHIISSFITGIGVVLAMQPFDFAATRMMNQQSANGKGAIYSGSFDVIVQTIRTEGIFGIYKGAFASYLRFGPYCVLVFVFLEQLRKLEDRIRKVIIPCPSHPHNK